MEKILKFLEGGPLFSLSGAFFDVFDNATIGPPSETSFSLSAPNGTHMVFHGNFTISGGAITGGTATGFELFVGQTKVAKATGYAVSYADLETAIAEAAMFDRDPFEDLFFSGATIKGSNEEDFLRAEVGGKLLGRDGNDYLDTGEGFTIAKGGDGQDILLGNGESRLSGGKGEDIFVLAPLGEGVDFFKDFSVKDDVVAISSFSYGEIPVGHLTDSYFHVGKGAETADHRAIYDKKTGFLYWDDDGSGVGAQVQVARLPDHLKLKADNIFVGDFI